MPKPPATPGPMTVSGAAYQYAHDLRAALAWRDELLANTDRGMLGVRACEYGIVSHHRSQPCRDIWRAARDKADAILGGRP